MGFVETTRKMADEVAAEAKRLQEETAKMGPQPLSWKVEQLCAAVEKLARCVSRRFPGTPDGEE